MKCMKIDENDPRLSFVVYDDRFMIPKSFIITQMEVLLYWTIKNVRYLRFEMMQVFLL
jgi:hypothetical protein